MNVNKSCLYRQRVISGGDTNGIFGVQSIHQIETNGSMTDAYNQLCNNDDIFIYSGHGAPGMIVFKTTGDITTGGITANSSITLDGYPTKDIDSLLDNKLAKSRCVIYLGCDTGVNYVDSSTTYNLVDSTYDIGAHFVMGITLRIYDTQANQWTKYFFNAINGNCNLGEAVKIANDRLNNIYVGQLQPDGSVIDILVEEFPSYYKGDGYQYFN